MKKRSVALIVLIVTILASLFYSQVAIAEPYGQSSSGSLKVDRQGGLDVSSGSKGSKTNYAGSQISISGGGFQPNSKYDILWDGKVLIDPYADSTGFASYDFTIPSTASAGIHTVAMQGTTTDGGTLFLSSNVTVITKTPEETIVPGTKAPAKSPVKAVVGADTKAPSETPVKSSNSKKTILGNLPFTGGGILMYILIAGLVLLIIGFGARITRKTK